MAGKPSPQSAHDEHKIDAQLQGDTGVRAMETYLAHRRQELRREDQRLAALQEQTRTLRGCMATLAGGSYLTGGSAA